MTSSWPAYQLSPWTENKGSDVGHDSQSFVCASTIDKKNNSSMTIYLLNCTDVLLQDSIFQQILDPILIIS